MAAMASCATTAAVVAGAVPSVSGLKGRKSYGAGILGHHCGGRLSGTGAASVSQTTRTSASVSIGRHQSLTPAYLRRENAKAVPRKRVGRAYSAQEDERTSQEPPTISSPPPPPPPAVDKKATAKAEIQKGQTTAIVTGAISILLAVGYLVLVQLLDTRGVNLIPPPPEAFDP